MTSLCLPAPAKVNLFLQITGRRPDGYHNLQTFFQFLDWADQLTFTLTDDGRIELENPLKGMAAADNLVIKAAQCLAPLRLNPKQGVRIHLEKNLPMGGGLGAGSSDAATTLLALNHLWQLHLGAADLQALGLQLGADVPVFLYGQSAWAEGIGERLQAWVLPEAQYLVIHPGCHCETAAFFRHRQLMRNAPSLTPEVALQRLGDNAFTALARQLYPSLDAAFIWLQQQGLTPWLTGTGACVFARLDSTRQGQALVQRLPATFAQQPALGRVVKGCQVSPAHQALQLL